MIEGPQLLIHLWNIFNHGENPIVWQANPARIDTGYLTYTAVNCDAIAFRFMGYVVGISAADVQSLSLNLQTEAQGKSNFRMLETNQWVSLCKILGGDRTSSPLHDGLRSKDY
uniref:Uncharacterized protein n=1 Tax=Desertifilum tharense IPPAS B-1220 TaxID=1781255 RepID=A0ACD5GRS8_9CYAN